MLHVEFISRAYFRWRKKKRITKKPNSIHQSLDVCALSGFGFAGRPLWSNHHLPLQDPERRLTAAEEQGIGALHFSEVTSFWILSQRKLDFAESKHFTLLKCCEVNGVKKPSVVTETKDQSCNTHLMMYIVRPTLHSSHERFHCHLPL